MTEPIAAVAGHEMESVLSEVLADALEGATGVTGAVVAGASGTVVVVVGASVVVGAIVVVVGAGPAVNETVPATAPAHETRHVAFTDTV